MSINNIISGMDDLQENQDGTLGGGFISVKNGRYRIIIDGSTPSYEYTHNPDNCDNTTNLACWNHKSCQHTSNDNDGPHGSGPSCSNDGKCVRIFDPGNTSSSSSSPTF